MCSLRLYGSPSDVGMFVNRTEMMRVNDKKYTCSRVAISSETSNRNLTIELAQMYDMIQELNATA